MLSKKTYFKEHIKARLNVYLENFECNKCIIQGIHVFFNGIMIQIENWEGAGHTWITLSISLWYFLGNPWYKPRNLTTFFPCRSMTTFRYLSTIYIYENDTLSYFEYYLGCVGTQNDHRWYTCIPAKLPGFFCCVKSGGKILFLEYINSFISVQTSINFKMSTNVVLPFTRQFPVCSGGKMGNLWQNKKLLLLGGPKVTKTDLNGIVVGQASTYPPKTTISSSEFRKVLSLQRSICQVKRWPGVFEGV